MPIPSTFIYWTGVVVGIGLYAFIICRTIDAIWETQVVGNIHSVLWGFILRPIIRWMAAFYALALIGYSILMSLYLFENPWKSLVWVACSVPIVRIFVWIFWLLSVEADTSKWTRGNIATHFKVGRAERFILWCFNWGPYEGLDPYSKRWKEAIRQDAAR